MPRQPRIAPGGLVYHVSNRSPGRTLLFRQEADFETFAQVLIDAQQYLPTRILSYCLLPNQWQFVVWPRKEGELSDFFRWLAHTHAMRRRAAIHRPAGIPLYRARFRNFPIQRSEPLLTVCRYVESLPRIVGLSRRAEQWRWGSLGVRQRGSKEAKAVLSEWPVERPADWVSQVNRPMSPEQIKAVEVSIRRGRPFGSPAWVAQTVSRLHMEYTIRPQGRPRNAPPLAD